MLLGFCLIFFQFQPDVVYKAVVYKKARISFAVADHHESFWFGVDRLDICWLFLWLLPMIIFRYGWL